MHLVAVLALPGFVPFDVGIPCEVFERVKLPNGKHPYSVRVCTPRPEVRGRAFRLRSDWRLEHLVSAHTVIVPGIDDLDTPIAPAVVDAIQSAWRRGARIASICSGAFVLAATGLLDGRRATTHWIAASELARRHPMIVVDPAVLFVDEGRILTSAGASAGLDMCLHLVRRDHGHAIAAYAAKLAVAPLEREGNQSQFIQRAPPRSASNLAPVIDWMQRHLGVPMDVPALAAKARMSSRTFARKFSQQTGTTPMQWLRRARILRARELLETTTVPIDRVAADVGYSSPVTFRTSFQRQVGLSPSAYRRRFSSASRPR